MNELQNEQAYLNALAQNNRERIAVILEGRDTAGKTGTIRTVTQYLNPSWFSVCLSSKPSQHDMDHWLASWGRKMPAENQIVFYDRSWYSRALVQPVNGWCSEKQYSNFMSQVIEWENNQPVHFIKMWLSISESWPPCIYQTAQQRIRKNNIKNRLTNKNPFKINNLRPGGGYLT